MQPAPDSEVGLLRVSFQPAKSMSLKMYIILSFQLIHKNAYSVQNRELTDVMYMS